MECGLRLWSDLDTIAVGAKVALAGRGLIAGQKVIDDGQAADALRLRRGHDYFGGGDGMGLVVPRAEDASRLAEVMIPGRMGEEGLFVAGGLKLRLAVTENMEPIHVEVRRRDRAGDVTFRRRNGGVSLGEGGGR